MTFEQEILNGFCDEAGDLLSKWEQICLELSKQQTNELYQELFRVAHNIKGGSRAVGLMAFGDFVHHIEDGITLLRENKVVFTVKINALLLEAQKHLQNWLDGVRNDANYKPEVQDFVQRYEQCLKGKDDSNPVTQNASSVPAPVQTATEEPTLAEIEAIKAISLENNIPEEKSAPKATTPVAPTAVKVAATAAADAPSKKNNENRSNETIRVSAKKLDQLIQTIGEISIQQSILWHRRDAFLENRGVMSALQLAQKLVKDLYEDALGLRMQPITGVFQKLERNVLDLSDSLGKSVSVEVCGSEVELDKSVIERIADPLLHIVRNAIDHGIENTEDRAKSGKPEKGSIKISATKDTFGVEIQVRDDGKGLAVDKILAKAKEKGLISQDTNLTKDQIYKLIFLPGFSTAEKVTDVSGRGVGMDVVMQSLRDLQGSIRIESEVGKGTTFFITLPTSVSIIEGMLIVLEGQRYVVPVTAVEEVIDIKTQADVVMRKMFQLRSQVIPVAPMIRVISRNEPSSKNNGALLICRQGQNRIGFAVDEVLGQQQVVIRPLHENIDGVFGLLGGTVLSDGEPGLILDMPSIANRYLDITRQKENAA